MPPTKSEDSSLPIHIGQTIINGVMDLKQEVGALGGKIDGLQSSVGDLHGRVAQCMTRDECAAVMHGHRLTPSTETGRASKDWWGNAQKRVGVIVGMLLIISTIGGAFLWMSSAYSAIQKVRQDVMTTTEAASRSAAVAASAATRAAATAASSATKEAAAAAARANKDVSDAIDRSSRRRNR